MWFLILFLGSIFVTPVFCQLTKVTLHYYGTFTLKIVSGEGQGQTLLGLSDSVDNSSPRKCVINALKNSILVMNMAVVDNGLSNVWPRAEICKYVGAQDSVVEISDSDIKICALYETVSTKIILTDHSYQVSIGDAKILKPRTLPLPIGESYLELSYLDPRGTLHQNVLLPIFVPEKGGSIAITPDILTQSLKVKL